MAVASLYRHDVSRADKDGSGLGHGAVVARPGHRVGGSEAVKKEVEWQRINTVVCPFNGKIRPLLISFRFPPFFPALGNAPTRHERVGSVSARKRTKGETRPDSPSKGREERKERDSAQRRDETTTPSCLSNAEDRTRPGSCHGRDDVGKEHHHQGGGRD